MLDPEVRRVLEGNSIAHLATVLPDGSPHSRARCGSAPTATGSCSSPARTRARHATCAATPGWRCPSRQRTTRSTPVVIRGHVVEWLEGDAAWEIIDGLANQVHRRALPPGRGAQTWPSIKLTGTTDRRRRLIRAEPSRRDGCDES